MGRAHSRQGYERFRSALQALGSFLAENTSQEVHASSPSCESSSFARPRIRARSPAPRRDADGVLLDVLAPSRARSAHAPRARSVETLSFRPHDRSLTLRASAALLPRRSAKKGTTPSQIGVLLRDNHGVAQVNSVTNSKILRILKGQGLAPRPPRGSHCPSRRRFPAQHMERNRKDMDSKFRLILIESRIHRLARYYKLAKKLAPNWKYDSATASTLVA